MIKYVIQEEKSKLYLGAHRTDLKWFKLQEISKAYYFNSKIEVLECIKQFNKLDKSKIGEIKFKEINLPVSK